MSKYICVGLQKTFMKKEIMQPASCCFTAHHKLGFMFDFNEYLSLPDYNGAEVTARYKEGKLEGVTLSFETGQYKTSEEADSSLKDLGLKPSKRTITPKGDRFYDEYHLGNMTVIASSTDPTDLTDVTDPENLVGSITLWKAAE